MTDASNIGMWILAAGVIGNTLMVWLKLSGRSEKREIQSPLIVQASEHYAPVGHEHPQYMTKADCRQSHQDSRITESEKFAHIHRQLESFGLKLDGALAEHNKLAESRANAIHGRISDLIPSIASVEGRLDDHIENHRRNPNG